MVEIGLTDLQKSRGGENGPPAPPVPPSLYYPCTALVWYICTKVPASAFNFPSKYLLHSGDTYYIGTYKNQAEVGMATLEMENGCGLR